MSNETAHTGAEPDVLPPTESASGPKDPSRSARLAGFELLADPASIAGGSVQRPDTTDAEEVQRLRAALSSREREIEQLRTQLERASAQTPGWSQLRLGPPRSSASVTPSEPATDAKASENTALDTDGPPAAANLLHALQQTRSALRSSREDAVQARVALRDQRRQLERVQHEAETQRAEVESLRLDREEHNALRRLLGEVSTGLEQVTAAGGIPVEDTPVAEPISQLAPAVARPEIFDPWHDEQIRRHFGPLGIDDLDDLILRPLASDPVATSQRPTLLLLGAGTARRAPALAERLLSMRFASFTILVADPTVGQAAVPPRSHPLAEFIESIPEPGSPAALADRLSRSDPRVIVCHDFLSRSDTPAPWLAALAGARSRGSALVLCEASGLPRVEADSEMAAIGDRIWQRMPDRYKLDAERGTPISSWAEAHATLPACAPVNDLRNAVRERFRTDLFAQFGVLSEIFVRSRIGSRFDADAPSDRRFLQQLADLDDRKIESGLAPPRYLVALVDRDRSD